MPINIVISGQKFLNQFKNDEDFTANTGDFTNNLAGSVMENIAYNFTIDINWFANSSDSDEWDLISGNQIVRTVGSFVVDGFSPGDICDWLQTVSTVPTIEAVIIIDSISEDGKTIVFTYDSGLITNSVDAGLRGLTPLTAIKYLFGLIENNETFKIQSKVSENDQGYYGSNIGFETGGGRDTNFVQLERLGQYKDWQTGSVKVKYVNNPSTYVQRFEINTTFMIVPYYLDGELTNLENNIIPSLLNGENALKYVFKPGFRTVLSNPNTEKRTIVSNNLGSVAWFNERFNGFQNNFTVENVVYRDANTLESADGLIIGTETLVDITISKTSGTFNRFGVYVSYLPEQDEYQNTTLTDLKENFIYDKALNSVALPLTTGDDFITELTGAIVSGDLVVTFKVNYSMAQKSFLSNKFSQGNANFLIGVQVGDITLPSGNSDRVMLLADAISYDDSADISGLIAFNKFDIYTPEKVIGIDTGSTDAELWNEDGIAIDYNFEINLNKSAFLNTLRFVVLAYNFVTNRFFELDGYDYNIANPIISGGVQQFNIDETRGYNKSVGSQFNLAELTTGSQAAGIQEYDGKIGQKMPWQGWIFNPNADTVFFETSEPNDNLNFKSSNYSELNDYSIVIGFEANISGVSALGVGGDTDYLILAPVIIVYEYDEDGNVTAIWTGVVQTFNNDTMALLGTAVMSGTDTLMKITWTNSNGAVASLGNIWVIHRLEETNQNGFNIDELDTFSTFPSNNRLIPKGTDTQLDMFIDSGNVVTECLIDGSLVTSGKQFNLSGRIGNPDDPIDPNSKLTSPDDSVKDLSGSAETKQLAP